MFDVLHVLDDWWEVLSILGVGLFGITFRQPYSRTQSTGSTPNLVCYTCSMRAGRTKTTSFSLDAVTRRNLKALAGRRHRGNVSALLAELAAREATFAAAEAYFEKYGIPPLTAEAQERIEAEWQRALGTKAKRRPAA